MRISIATYFDCTATGVTGNFRQAQLPMTDRADQAINSELDWHRSRNQQRNFETLTQLINLYTQPLNLTLPVYNSVTKIWSFEFDVEFAGIFSTEFDPLGLLKQQAQHVPMITGLAESDQTQRQLITDVNIFIKELNITD